MQTKNLGLVKALFVQSSAPTRTDVLWYDTNEELLKIYDIITLSWLSLLEYQVEAALTDGAPTPSEINGAVGMTAVTAGIGFKVTIKDTSGSELLYKVESDGTDWYYIAMTKSV